MIRDLSDRRCAGCGQPTQSPHEDDCDVLTGRSEARMIVQPDGGVKLTMPDGTILE